MRNLIIILLTVLVVITGAFLPEILLKRDTEPVVNMDYQQVSITSQSSSDYAWRMERIGEHYFGEGEHLLMTYISEVESSDTDNEIVTLQAELNGLIAQGVVHPAVGEMLADQPMRVRYYYLFDSEAVSGFRIAELEASGVGWDVSLCVDVVSGKLAKIHYGGSRLIPGGNAVPVGNSGWYDMLRGYADYLGLGNSIPTVQTDSADQPARRYYELSTADRLTAHLTGSEWLEVRALKESGGLTLCVYNGGK